jgi:hypothetical protein
MNSGVLTNGSDGASGDDANGGASDGDASGDASDHGDGGASALVPA